jgi:hypothetical protein
MVHQHVESAPEYRAMYGPAQAEIAELQRILPQARFSVTQVTFFAARISERAQRIPDRIGDGDILGTCLIINVEQSATPGHNSNVRRSYIFEAVIAFPTVPAAEKLGKRSNRTRLLNNYHHVGDPIEIVAGGRKFTLEGAYFCQQNGINTVCGHAALKMALWHVRGFSDQPETALMNAVANDGRRALSEEERPRGDLLQSFHLWDLRSICKELGVATLWIDFDKEPRVSQPDEPTTTPYEYAYLLVESGIPTVIIFVSDEDSEGEIYHVLPVIGHTMNSDEWLPHAVDWFEKMSPRGRRGGRHQYVPSVEWAAHLIVHDDLLGPYMCLNASSFPGPLHPNDIPPKGRVRWVFGFLSGDTVFSYAPHYVQEVASEYIRGLGLAKLGEVKGPWKRRLERFQFSDTKLVLRTQVIRRESYIKHIRAARDHERRPSGIGRRKSGVLEGSLPHVMWMTEFSCVELFSANRSKIGEILFPLEFDDEYLKALQRGKGPPPALFRMINYMLLYGEETIDLTLRSHIPLFKRRPAQVEF